MSPQGIPRVSSTASELNDFTETKEGKKLYNVRQHINSIKTPFFLPLLTSSLQLAFPNGLFRCQNRAC